jgi:hypothetical protein
LKVYVVEVQFGLGRARNLQLVFKQPPSLYILNVVELWTPTVQLLDVQVSENELEKR